MADNYEFIPRIQGGIALDKETLSQFSNQFSATQIEEMLSGITQHGTIPGHSSQLARSYYDSLLIRMSYLDSDIADTKVTLFGHEFDSPICVTALSHLRQFGYHSTGMEELAKAAAATNTINFCGICDLDELRKMVATGAKVIHIFKPYEDMNKIKEIIQAAEEMGVFALGTDIDHSFTKEGTLESVDGDRLMSMTTETLKEIISMTKLPFVVKGVLSVEDAEKAIEAGASAVFVSHHHGLSRFMTPPAMMLPDIVKVVNGRVPIIIDGNIESGYDAFKALALGADITAVGRPLVPYVTKHGAEGVVGWINGQTASLAGIMSRSCCTKISDIDQTHIIKAGHRF